MPTMARRRFLASKRKGFMTVASVGAGEPGGVSLVGEARRRSFGHGLVEQTWTRDLPWPQARRG
jgi:hypothetical protein